MRIRRADAEDAYVMASLDREIFTIPWSYEAFVSEFSYPGAVYYLALDGDEPVGYAGMRTVAGEGYITNVAVREGYRRQGIARSLLGRLFSAGPSSFTLEVRRGNVPALSLYTSLGFKPEGIRKGYYADNKEDAVIMWKRDMKDVTILAIESSCDETAAAVVRNRREVLSNVIASQIDIHTLYGGVVPEIASRKHLENVNDVVDRAMADAGMRPEDIDAIAVTEGPGLVGALVIGISEAKALSWAWNKPLIGVHHIRGHISAIYIEHEELEPPFITLVASGGHTQIVLVRDYDDLEVLGTSRDDAAGEAFDKVARVIGLGYPGGPKIDAKAKEGSRDAVVFTRPYIDKGSLDFSFSGIKTQVLNYVNGLKQKGAEVPVADIAAGFQEAVVEVMTEKTIDAAKRCGIPHIALTGGVASNSRLREVFEERCAQEGMDIYFPSKTYCTDNAAMIGACAYTSYVKGSFDGLDMDAHAELELTER